MHQDVFETLMMCWTQQHIVEHMAFYVNFIYRVGNCNLVFQKKRLESAKLCDVSISQNPYCYPLLWMICRHTNGDKTRGIRSTFPIGSGKLQ